MDNIGAEVGQKMRSAIKAKLMELGCYVDDELPDYIMVMVANKRTKSQMNEDLQLFLTTKTAPFVDWLQIVLKKLKEITVTNPDIYKRVSKRKSDDLPKAAVKVKKEKKDKSKSSKKAKKKELAKAIIKDIPQVKSLTDDLPVEASKLSEMRKIVVMQENQNSNSNISNVENVNEDSFDIPPLSEVAMSNDNELAEIEKKIRSVKSRLGLQVPSESEDEDFIDIKAEPDELFPTEQAANLEPKQKKVEEKSTRKIRLVRTSQSVEELTEAVAEPCVDSAVLETSPKQRNEHPRIFFANQTVGKKQSVLERLGKRPNVSSLEDTPTPGLKRTKISLANIRREEEEILGMSRPSNDDQILRVTNNIRVDHKDKHRKDETEISKNSVTMPSIGPSADAPRESALKRLGVMSKVAVPQKEPEPESEEEVIICKDVPSSVKVKPRVMPPSNKQANKNLLLKAVAEAQRSIAQTPVVGANVKPDALFTKRYRDKITHSKNSTRKLPDKEKNKIKNLLAQVDRKDKREVEFSSDDDNLEYVPKPLKRNPKSNEQLEYIPSSKEPPFDEYDNYIEADCSDVDTDNDKTLSRPRSKSKKNKSQTFIITLDGIARRQERNKSSQPKEKSDCDRRAKSLEESRKRKSPSPIIFSPVTSPVVTKGKLVPDKLPVVFAQASIKTKERCKYWPLCRQGDKCEFVHPSTPCKIFPQCKFGEKCLYIHPMCKFETSCTRKDCPYSHVPRPFANAPASAPQMCKFYPNCSNNHCMFYHPRPCKYGKYCKNQSECNFTHGFATKSNFTWRSAVKL